MTSKLGVYWSVEHRRQEDYNYFKDLNPSVIKVMDGGNSDYEWIKNNLPDSLVVARDWAMSEQHSDMLKDPMATGKRHAAEWNDHQSKLGFDRTKTLILGINEPKIWEAGVPEALRIYTISLCYEAKKFNLRVGAMQLSVGWPNNTGPDTLPDWSHWDGVDTAILANNGALICHEYWADQGPSENWGWWAGRVLKCPWQVPIVIGECGVDMFVKTTSGDQQTRGWIGHMPPERYAAELWEYVGRMSVDRRFVGCAVFASDFQAHEWYSFDVQPAYQKIISYKIPDTPPVKIFLPSIENDGPTPIEPKIPAVPENLVPGKPTGKVMASLLNVRRQPGTAGEIVGTKKFGDKISILEKSQQDDDFWYRIGPDQWVIAEWVAEDATQNVAQDDWKRAREFTARWEGGFQKFDWDAGNWTGGEVGKGMLVGTNFGISAASYPNLDIPNLTRAQADQIYYRDYWLKMGCEKMTWPRNVIVFDTAINFGTENAKYYLDKSKDNLLAFIGLRLRGYRVSRAWPQSGAAWIDRTADLIALATGTA